VSVESIPSRRGSGGSPFLTAAAAARLAGLTPATLGRRLAAGDLPGYRLGRRWFVPEAEFRRHLRRRAWMMQADAAPEVVRELTRALPSVLGVEDLERFLGVRRPLLHEALRMPGFAGVGGRAGIGGRGATTIAVLERTLLDSRNGCVPCLQRTSCTAREVA